MLTVSWWEIPYAGGVRRLSVEQGEDGREFVRLDGRSIAKALDPQENERQIVIANELYLLRRNPGGFGFDLEFPPERPVLEMTAEAKAAGWIGGVQAAAESLQLSRFLWVVVGAIVCLMMYCVIPKYENEAVKRVRLLLPEMKTGTQKAVDHQFAMGIWMRNTRTPDRDELEWAWKNYKLFLEEKNLRRPFSSWEVVESEMVEGTKFPTARVTVRIDGVEYRMLVPEKHPIAWAP